MTKAVVKNDELMAKAETAVSVENEQGKTKSISRELAEMQATIMLARQFRRNESDVADGIMVSCGRREFAEQSFYAYPRGGITVTGASVNMARELARLWGNIRYGLDVIMDNDEERTIEGWAWDVETNTKVVAQDTFKKLIYRKVGGWLKPDERDLRELTNRRGAILVRNSILQLMPKDIVETALKAAHATVAGSFRKSKPNARQKAINGILGGFEAFGVSTKQIEAYLGHELKGITNDEVADLRGVWNAIKDGESKETWFKTSDVAKTNEALSLGKIKEDK